MGSDLSTGRRIVAEPGLEPSTSDSHWLFTPPSLKPFMGSENGFLAAAPGTEIRNRLERIKRMNSVD